MQGSSNDRFVPPDEGLLSGETVLWHQKAGSPFIVFFCGGCLPLLSVFLIPFIAVSFGESIAAGIALTMLMIFLYLLTRYVIIRRTSYYLTTERLVEARGKKIVEEINRSWLAGKEEDEFLKFSENHRSGGDIFYDVRIYDIERRKMIELHSIEEDELAKLQSQLGAS